MRSSRPDVVVDALAARYGGTARAAVKIAIGMAEDEALGRVLVIADTASTVAAELRGIPEVDVLTPIPVGRAALARRVGWQAVVLPRVVSRGNRCVVLSFSGLLPGRVGCPVVSYHGNALMLVGQSRADALRRVAARRTARREHGVLVPTRAMQIMMKESLGVEAAVVPLGVDHDQFAPAVEPGGDILVVADFYPHKRHDLAIEAWARLPTPRPRLRLVGDGRVAPDHHGTVLRLARARAGADQVVVEQALTPLEMAGRYRAARVLVQPSERESFSLPVVESLACGTPVIARDLASLLETAGPGGSFVAGDDPDAWAEGLRELLGDNGRHAALREAGRQHARGYSWERTVGGIRDHLLAAVGQD